MPHAGPCIPVLDDKAKDALLCPAHACIGNILALWFYIFFSLSLPPHFHSLSLQNHLLQSELELSKYDRVLVYWRTCCLPPTAAGGVLSIMGLLQVVDVSYYLQYYSLPVLTALLTPIVKIILSLKAVYFPR